MKLQSTNVMAPASPAEVAESSALATASLQGAMSASDKSKLDGLPSTILTAVSQGKVLAPSISTTITDANITPSSIILMTIQADPSETTNPLAVWIVGAPASGSVNIAYLGHDNIMYVHYVVFN